MHLSLFICPYVGNVNKNVAKPTQVMLYYKYLYYYKSLSGDCQVRYLDIFDRYLRESAVKMRIRKKFKIHYLEYKKKWSC